jgi:beta-lactamase class A
MCEGAPPGRLFPRWGAWAAAVLLGLGVAAAESAPPRLRDCPDPSLQARLEEEVGHLGLAPAVGRGRLGLALVDLWGDGPPRLAMINGDRMMYAASLPKIAILLGAFVQAERGQLVLDEPTLASLHRMIRNSSNPDANAMLARIGEAELLHILTSPRFRFYDPETGGGLWVGKAYGKAPAYSRDPLRGLSHGATAFQVARFYYLLDRGVLVSPELTRQMKATLADPALHHKFVKGLESRPAARLYRKSGTWRQFHSDSVLVEGQGRRYILVALAEDPRGGEWLTRMAAPIDELMSRRAARAGR